MLNSIQYEILWHLCMFSVASKRTLDILVGEDTDYSLRPLVRYKYISKRSDGLYSPLSKAKRYCEDTAPLVAVGGTKEARERAAKISKMAALFAFNGINPWNEIPLTDINCFISSNIWRTIRLGHISTVRFTGMLFYNGLRLAVYDIEDSVMEWQTYAESSLMFETYCDCETAADGMLFICDGNGAEIARDIIKRTLWEKNRLIKPENYFYESVKPVKYSKSPIRIKSTYKKVLLAEIDDVMKVLDAAVDHEQTIEEFTEKYGGSTEVWERCGDVEIYPDRYYINLENDLLQYVYCYMNVQEADEDGSCIRYHMVMPKKYKLVGEMLGCDVRHV